MKRFFISLIAATTCSIGLSAQTITVTHSETGKMADEIVAALGSTAPDAVTSLTIAGPAIVSYDDCRAIAAKFPTTSLITLDLSGAKFENDSIPGSPAESSVGAFDVSGNGMQVQEIKLPADLKILGGRAFRKFSKLKTMELPKSLVKIGEGAFTMCGSIDYAELPPNLKTIEGYAFYQAYSMKSLTELPETLEGVIGTLAFGQTSVAISEIPKGVTGIGANAFNAGTRAVSLEMLVIYQNVASIGAKAFQNQTKLRNIEVNRMTPPETSADAFLGVPAAGETLSAIDLYIPQGAKDAFNVAPWNEMTIYDVLDAPSGIGETELVTFNVYPNPVVDKITIQTQDDLEITSAQIVNISGAKVKNLDVNSSLTFDVSELAEGIYFLQLNNAQTVKFIKK